MNSKKSNGFRFMDKGYYIALVLCAAAIGISGYLYYRNASKPIEPNLNTPTLEANATTPEDDVPVGGTEPLVEPTDPGVKPTQPQKTPLKTGLPVEGKTVSAYAMDCLTYNPTTRDWRVHNGIDIAAEAGTKVCAAAKGTVYTTYEDDTMGTTVVIRHSDGYVTRYSSLNGELKVAPGDKVTLGQVIGTVANTALLETAIGDHIHFSVTKDDVPMDPAAFLKLG